MWDQRYAQEKYAYGKKPNDFLVNTIKYIKPKAKVLCLAEGEGRNANFLAKQGFSVFAMDSSSMGKKKAIQLAKESAVEFVYTIASLEEFDFGYEKWDAIISIFAHTDKKTQLDTFSKVQQSLVKGGLFLLEGYNKYQLENNTGGPKNIDMLFDLKEIKDSFNGFEFIIEKNVQRQINEGLYHTGKSNTVQFVAKKSF
ncbi:MAG: methyltransferase domain-containing protein [Bacteriovoracaceae bacterium]|jgi:2-polyprenyl-3-methyl-5-hydroxy-6-metoxy-1,4-benzoquinol methylase|nr:methyltransferase domain-containing protein [Bacteriovoracaceae bacterium]